MPTVVSGCHSQHPSVDYSPWRWEVFGQAAIAPPLHSARAAGMLVVRTREGHSSDLADYRPVKPARWHLTTGIGDQGPMGRILESILPRRPRRFSLFWEHPSQ